MFETNVSMLGGSVFRIEDGSQTYKSGGQLKMFRKKQPFDYVARIRNSILFIDCKATESMSIPRSSSIIKSHQVEALSALEGPSISGFLIWFLTTNNIIFFKASQFNELKRGNGLKPIQGLSLGTSESFDLNILIKGAP